MKIPTVILLILGFTNPLFSQSTNVTQPGDATPDAAIESFFRSLLEGDAKKANTFLMAPERMADYCRTQVELYDAFRHLGDVSEKQFGEKGKAFRTPMPASAAVARLKKVKPEVSGNRAIWKSNPKAPMTLHKVDGHWKLSIYSSYKKPSQLELTNQLFQRITKYTNAIASQIADGQFKTVGDVQSELKRQRKLMNQEMVPKLRKAE